MKENSIKNERSSIEEDMKILEEFLDLARTRDYKGNLTGSFDEFELEVEEKEYKAIENLIKGYRELEERTKKNIEPVLVNNKMYFIDKELYEDLLKDIKTNYIVKSKVKEKIEELDKEKLKYDNDLRIYTLRNTFDFQKEVLQELLEGGD